MSKKSLLAAIIDAVTRKTSPAPTRSVPLVEPEENQQEQEPEVVSDLYVFGCSPTAGNKIIRGLKQGGNYPGSSK
jgi:hypothetical protein